MVEFDIATKHVWAKSLPNNVKSSMLTSECRFLGRERQLEMKCEMALSWRKVPAITTEHRFVRDIGRWRTYPVKQRRRIKVQLKSL